MRAEFQALLLTVPCVLFTVIVFNRDKHLTTFEVSDANKPLNQLLGRIQQAQWSVAKGIADEQSSMPINDTTVMSYDNLTTHIPASTFRFMTNESSDNYTIHEWNASFVDALFHPKFNFTRVVEAVASIQDIHSDSTRNIFRSIYNKLIDQVPHNLPKEVESLFDMVVFLNKTMFDGHWNAAVHFIVPSSVSQNETRVDEFFRALRE